MSVSHGPAIEIPTDAWEPTGEYLDDPTARLQTTFIINGITMSLEAFAVRDLRDPLDAMQRVVCSNADDALDKIVRESGWPVQTLTVHDREYILVATPTGALA